MKKTIIWLGNSRRAVSLFEKQAKRLIGHSLMRLQAGLEPIDWKPMQSIGKGVREIRIRSGSEYRVIYVAKFQDTVHILHVFSKKTQKTSKQAIDLARKRYKELMSEV